MLAVPGKRGRHIDEFERDLFQLAITLSTAVGDDVAIDRIAEDGLVRAVLEDEPCALIDGVGCGICLVERPALGDHYRR